MAPGYLAANEVSKHAPLTFWPIPLSWVLYRGGCRRRRQREAAMDIALPGERGEVISRVCWPCDERY